jgi:hypothetical protein
LKQRLKKNNFKTQEIEIIILERGQKTYSKEEKKLLKKVIEIEWK